MTGYREWDTNIYVNYAGDPNSTAMFPSLPEQISVQAATRFMTFDLINSGEVKTPLGEELTKFSWSGMFFGEARKNERFVKIWVDPKDMQSAFSEWRASGAKLHLLITGTTINHYVYLDNYECKYVGGYGDMEYSISFVVAKDVLVRTENETLSSSITSGGNWSGKIYTVSPGESLWSIAQDVYGDGSMYTRIFEANKNQIYVPDLIIHPGQTLKLP